MLLLTHSIVGATIASKIKNPLFSLPLIFALHFLLDSFPHWDVGTNFKKRPWLKNFFFAFLDGITVLAVVFFLFQYQKPFSLLLWLGVTTSLIPDIIEAPAMFLGIALFPLMDRFHNQIAHQKSSGLFWGLVPQVLIVLACLLIVNV